MRTMFVNVYEVERAYGGPEEGGWWYDAGTILETRERLCACELPVVTWPVWDENGREGCHAELDTFFANHDENSCEAYDTFQEVLNNYKEFKDVVYPQIEDDDSDIRRGESLSSGTIRIRIELDPGVGFPSVTPVYS